MTNILKVAVLLIFFSQSGLSLATVICWRYDDPRLQQSMIPVPGMPSEPTMVRRLSLTVDANTAKNTAVLGTLASVEVDFDPLILACFETELRPQGTQTSGGPYVPLAPLPMPYKVLVGQGIAANGQPARGPIAATTLPGIGVRVTSIGRALFPTTGQPSMFYGRAPYNATVTGTLAEIISIFPRTGIAAPDATAYGNTYRIDSEYKAGYWNGKESIKYRVELIKLSNDIQSGTLSGPALSIMTGTAENLRIDFGGTRVQGDIGCTLNTPNITKYLGDVPISKFNAVGSTSEDVSFQIDFNCKPGTQVKMTATAGTPATPSGFKGVIGLTPDPTAMVAQGIGVQLIRSDEKCISMAKYIHVSKNNPKDNNYLFDTSGKNNAKALFMRSLNRNEFY